LSKPGVIGLVTAGIKPKLEAPDRKLMRPLRVERLEQSLA
jgi:hypothetical protein